MLAALRSRRAAFWYLAPDRIVAAVVARGSREPVLEACAASYAPSVAGASFAPGVLEVSWVLRCERLVHVAALASSFCRLEQLEDGDPGAWGTAVSQEPARRQAVADDVRDYQVWGSEAACAEASELFRRSRLHLLALDCEPCALMSLADALGTADPDDARRQHLSAVAVLPESEGAAEALGEDLAVPVGLAVSWLGASGKTGRAL